MSGDPFELVGFFYQSPSRNSFTIETVEEWRNGEKIFLSKLDLSKLVKNPGLTVKLYRLRKQSKRKQRQQKTGLRMKTADPSLLKLNLFEVSK